MNQQHQTHDHSNSNAFAEVTRTGNACENHHYISSESRVYRNHYYMFGPKPDYIITLVYLFRYLVSPLQTHLTKPRPNPQKVSHYRLGRGPNCLSGPKSESRLTRYFQLRSFGYESI